jgi:hypothetical protein
MLAAAGFLAMLHKNWAPVVSAADCPDYLGPLLGKAELVAKICSSWEIAVFGRVVSHSSSWLAGDLGVFAAVAVVAAAVAAAAAAVAIAGLD